MIKVYWDAYGLDHAGSGIFVHADSLLKNLRELGVEPTLVGVGKFAKNFPSARCHEIFAAPIARNKIFAPLVVAQWVEKNRSVGESAILHGLSNINLPALESMHVRKNLKSVVTVHDLIPLIARSGGVSFALYWQIKLLMPRVLARADAVVCVSEWTKRTLREFFPSVDERKMVVIRNGFSSPVSRGAGRGDRLSMLTVARDEKYKRLDLATQICRASSNASKLHIITSAEGAKRLSAQNQDLIAQGRLEISSELSHNEVLASYQKANVYLHPSLYEGFCLPAAEALACGIPVVHTSGSGIDEVVPRNLGKALPPQASVDEWCNAIADARQISKNEAFSAELASYFAAAKSWKDAAKELKSLYESII